MSTKQEFLAWQAAIESADGAAIQALATSGANLNARDEWGDPLLFFALQNVEFAASALERESAMAVVVRLVELGADVSQLADDGASILVSPVLGARIDVVKDLLNLGVDPNRGCAEPWETVYDLALFDYGYEAELQASLPALSPPEGITHDVDAVLGWLEREASTMGYPQPEIPRLLRRYGALSGIEVCKRLGGRSGQQVRWGDGGWVLKD